MRSKKLPIPQTEPPSEYCLILTEGEARKLYALSVSNVSVPRSVKDFTNGCVDVYDLLEKFHRQLVGMGIKFWEPR